MLLQYLGKVGLVNSVNLDETEAVLTYSIRSTRFHVVTAALKKVCVGAHELAGLLLYMGFEPSMCVCTCMSCT